MGRKRAKYYAYLLVAAESNFYPPREFKTPALKALISERKLSRRCYVFGGKAMCMPLTQSFGDTLPDALRMLADNLYHEIRRRGGHVTGDFLVDMDYHRSDGNMANLAVPEKLMEQCDADCSISIPLKRITVKFQF